YADWVGEEVGLRIETFGHAGDGNMHINLIRDDLDEGEWKARVDRGMDLLYQKAEELDGMVSGEHGIGHSKRRYLCQYTDPRQLELMRQIKAVFDPGGILNPETIL
ncbi:MAG: FAD-linked oxidase C-terminal domain-containing protein, partial [Bacillota bacterium]